MKRATAVIAALAFAGGASAQPVPPPGAAPPVIDAPMQPRAVVEELTALLRARIGDRDSRRRDRTLTGLREVRDPGMLAFFSQLSINPAPLLRVHGLLGLAELEPQRGLDLLGVWRISDPRLQGVIVSEAMAANLIGDDTRSELTSWPSLPARLRLDLAADCAARSRPFNVSSVRKLLADPDAFVAVAAAVVLKQALVETAAAEQTIRTRAAGLGQSGGVGGTGEAAAELAAFVVSHNLTAAGEALDIAASALKPGPAADAVSAARLLTSPVDAAVVNAARARLDIAVPVSDRSAFAVKVLEVALRLGVRTPGPVVSEMATDPDPLIKAIAGAARELAAEDGTVGTAVGALARRGHLPTVVIALRCADERHWQDARTIRAAVVDGIAKRQTGAAVDPQLADLAVRAAASLCDDDPRSLDRPLAEALSAADGPLTRIILEGALRSRHDRTGALVRQGAFEPRPTGPWPTPEAAALALLVAVRHQEFTADPAERIERLTAIARGDRGRGGGGSGDGGGLSGIVRAQAAWLALRESGEARVALTRILSDLPPASTDTPDPFPTTAPPPSAPWAPPSASPSPPTPVTKP